MAKRKTKTDIERFEKFVETTENCHNWGGYLSEKGYAKFTVSGKPVRAARWIYEYLNGPIPDGLQVCHKCDNRKCVNPEHLFIGSATDNRRDMISKGRSKSKLTPLEVIDIRNKYLTREYTKCSLAKTYNVSETQIARIVNYKGWICFPKDIAPLV